MPRAVLAVALVLASSCLPDPFDPEVGAQLQESCADADAHPDVRVSYRDDVVPLLRRSCYGCHTPEGRLPIGIEVGRFDMSTYSTLRAGGAVSGTRIVIPGSPCASALIDKVSEYPSFGARMPLSGPPFLPDDEIQLLHDWIAEGARED